MNKEKIQSVTFTLVGSVLQLTSVALISVLGFVLLIVGLGKLKDNLDEAGASAVGLIRLGAILGAVGAVIGLIPLIGLVGGIFGLVAFILEVVGYFKLKDSQSIGEVGKNGVNLILLAILVAIIGGIIGFFVSAIPVVGTIVTSIFAAGAIILMFLGWLKIQEGLIES